MRSGATGGRKQHTRVARYDNCRGPTKPNRDEICPIRNSRPGVGTPARFVFAMPVLMAAVVLGSAALGGTGKSLPKALSTADAPDGEQAVDPVRLTDRPLIPAGVASVTGASQQVSRQAVPVENAAWLVTHAVSASGTFMLVRNTSAADGESVQVSVHGGAAIELAPRQTTTFECAPSADGATALAVKAISGAPVYSAPIRCGDAVYLKSKPTGD